MKRCLYILMLLLLAGCSSEPSERQRSFYFWRSRFELSPSEIEALNQLSDGPLYLKLFDVSIDPVSETAKPQATLRGSGNLPAGKKIIPVIFITNETLGVSSFSAEALAKNMMRLAEKICSRRGWELADEVQIDCDWTETTKDRYFELLQAIRKEPFLKGRKLSVTIRLHQLKFRKTTGIPPADKGLLMAYNMGNLKDPRVKNSILETAVLEQYIGYANDYPLPLDAGLPVFDWYVLFRDGKFKALLPGDALGRNPSADSTMWIKADTVRKGYNFLRGDWLRYERPSTGELEKAARLLSERLPSRRMRVVLYHLDDHNLQIYPPHEMEAVFDRFD